MSCYYDRQGRPITMEQWATALEGRSRRIGFDTIKDDGTGQKAEVSTVWLGLDHRFREGPPLIFETMVFGGKFDQEQERYSTEEEALAGHARWVAAVRGDSETSAALCEDGEGR